MFGKKNPGVMTIDTIFFQKMVKQHENRRDYLAGVIQNLDSEKEAVITHHNELSRKIVERCDSALNDLENQKQSIVAEHQEVSKRTEALKALVGSL